MEQRLLPQAQMTEIFALIVQAHLDPAAFRWSIVDSRFEPDVRIHSLEFEDGRTASFEFHRNPEGHAAWYRPGGEGEDKAHHGAGTWQRQIALVQRWLLGIRDRAAGDSG